MKINIVLNKKNILVFTFFILAGLFIIFKISNYFKKINSYKNEHLYSYLYFSLQEYFEDYGYYPKTIEKFNSYAKKEYETNFIKQTTKHLSLSIYSDSVDNTYSIRDKGFGFLFSSNAVKKINELRIYDAFFYIGQVELFSDTLFSKYRFKKIKNPIFLKDNESISIDTTFNLYKLLSGYHNEYFPEKNKLVWIPGTIKRKQVIVCFSKFNDYKPKVLYSEIENVNKYNIFFNILQKKLSNYDDKIDKAIIPIFIPVEGELLPAN